MIIAPAEAHRGLLDRCWDLDGSDGVATFHTGSPVRGFTTAAAYAELVVVDADHIIAKPTDMP